MRLAESAAAGRGLDRAVRWIGRFERLTRAESERVKRARGHQKRAGGPDRRRERGDEAISRKESRGSSQGAAAPAASKQPAPTIDPFRAFLMLLTELRRPPLIPSLSCRTQELKGDSCNFATSLELRVQVTPRCAAMRSGARAGACVQMPDTTLQRRPLVRPRRSVTPARAAGRRRRVAPPPLKHLLKALPPLPRRDRPALLGLHDVDLFRLEPEPLAPVHPRVRPGRDLVRRVEVPRAEGLLARLRRPLVGVPCGDDRGVDLVVGGEGHHEARRTERDVRVVVDCPGVDRLRGGGGGGTGSVVNTRLGYWTLKKRDAPCRRSCEAPASLAARRGPQRRAAPSPCSSAQAARSRPRTCLRACVQVSDSLSWARSDRGCPPHDSGGDCVAAEPSKRLTRVPVLLLLLR